MSEPSALPCPFCGGEVDPIGWLDGHGERGPECDGCGATAPSMEVWQQRQLQPVQLQFPTVLRKMWSGGDVQEWLEAQGNIYRLASKPDEPVAPAPGSDVLSLPPDLKMVLCDDEVHVINLDARLSHCGWVMRRHPAGGLVSVRQATVAEIMQAKTRLKLNMNLYREE